MDRLNIYPLEPITEETDPENWLDHVPPAFASGRQIAHEYWRVKRPIRLHLTGVPLVAVTSEHFHTRPSEYSIDVERGYVTDCSSGPMVNDCKAQLAGLVHDVICHPVHTPQGTVYAVASYWRRHWLYSRVLRAQGATRRRATYTFVGLILGNWAVMLDD